MKPYRHIKLDEPASIMLNEGHKNGKKSHFRIRCHAILLSSKGYRVDFIASLYKKRSETIRDWMNDWDSKGIIGLMIQQGRGRKGGLSVNNPSTVELIKKKSKNNRSN